VAWREARAAQGGGGAVRCTGGADSARIAAAIAARGQRQRKQHKPLNAEGACCSAAPPTSRTAQRPTRLREQRGALSPALTWQRSDVISA
jgi:hypothetical protein